MRYTSKAALAADIRMEHDRLVTLLDETPIARFRDAWVWGEGWTLTDLVAHLAEWQEMFLGWHRSGRHGKAVELPAPGFKWSETPRLNRVIQERHSGRSPREVRAWFERGYGSICRIVDAATPAQLFTPGVFAWTGRNGLVTYLGANTASHYRFARKVIERWRRRAPARR
jgi:hypothetical protein